MIPESSTIGAPAGRGRHAVVVAVAASLLLAGCLGESDDGDATKATAPPAGRERNARSGDLWGAIRLTRTNVRPGDTIRVITRNRGRETLHYRVSSLIERRVQGGGFEQAFPPGPVPTIGLRAKPGRTQGPRYDGVVDEVELPSDLEPGFYRVLKDAGPSLDELDALTLGARFAVHPAPGDLPPGGEELWGTTFLSAAVTEDGEPRDLVPGTRIEVTFREERGGRRGVGWEAGCNMFGATTVVTADRILTDPIVGTLVGCSGALEAQDEWLRDFFGAEPSWELDDGALTLRSGETAIELEAD